MQSSIVNYFSLCVITWCVSGTTAQRGLGPPHAWGFEITHNETTVGRNPVDEGSALRRDLYLATHNTHNRQTPIPPAGFEPSPSKRAAVDPHLRPLGHWDWLQTESAHHNPWWANFIIIVKNCFLQFWKTAGWQQMWCNLVNSENVVFMQDVKWPGI